MLQLFAVVDSMYVEAVADCNFAVEVVVELVAHMFAVSETVGVVDAVVEVLALVAVGRVVSCGVVGVVVANRCW